MNGPGLRIGIGSQSRGGAGAAPLILSATHTRLFENRTTINKQAMSRSAHDAVCPISKLAVVAAGFYIQAGDPSERALGGSQTVTASVEYPSGTFTQITFDGGSTSGTCPDGGILVSDEMDLGFTIPQGATFWIRMFRDSPTGVLFNGFHNSARGDRAEFGTSLTDKTLSGSIGQAGNNSSGPQAVLARNSTAPGILVMGDSKTTRYFDTAMSTTAADEGLRGEICRSLGGYAFNNIATSALRANTWSTEAVARAAMLPYYSHYIVNLGHNDAYVDARSAAEIQADLESIYSAILAANPAAKITAVTQTHKSTSTDNWATTANQTFLSQTNQINSLNAVIRAGGMDGVNNGFIEMADEVSTARDSGLWKNDGSTANLWTSDGIHETPFAYGQIEASGAVDPAVIFA
jgi:lysophospholipase L1-like esterase